MVYCDMKLEGYVIVPPLSPWDQHHKEEIWLSMSYGSFGRTPVEAWKRSIHSSQHNVLDFSVIVQRWFDRGYRVKKATIEILEESEQRK